MKNLIKIIALLSVTLGAFSCIDKEFDAPEKITPVFEKKSEITTITIAELKNKLGSKDHLYINEDTYIEGYVISDDEPGNFYKMIIIQDSKEGAKGGIQVKIEWGGLYNHFKVGQKVYINLNGLCIGTYGNEPQIGQDWYFKYRVGKTDRWETAGINKHFVETNIFKDGEPIAIEPTVLSFDELSEEYKFSLVKFDNVQFTESNKKIPYSLAEGEKANQIFPFTSLLIQDKNNNEITLFTSHYAKFASELTPEGSGSIKGVLGAHNGSYQLNIRDIDDVKMENPRFEIDQGSASTTPVESIDVAFEDQKDKTNLTIEGWLNYTEKGSRKWQGKHWSSDKYAQCTGYTSKDPEMVMWLITSAIDLTEQKYLTFDSAKSYWEHDNNENPFELLISYDFDGKNVKAATWESLNGNFANYSSADNAWIQSGEISLPIKPKGFIAFKYSGTNVKTTTYRIDNIKVFKK